MEQQPSQTRIFIKSFMRNQINDLQVVVKLDITGGIVATFSLLIYALDQINVSGADGRINPQYSGAVTTGVGARVDENMHRFVYA